jgi:DNA-binding beta-propeller fold protein YncE
MTEPSNNLDLTGRTAIETGRALLTAYDASRPSETICARIDSLPAALSMWLIEAGARFESQMDDDGTIHLSLTRARSPALTAAPGLHHIVSHSNGNLWAAERDTYVARIDGETGEVLAVAAVAKKASHLAVDPSGKLLYLADFAAAELVAMDAETLEVEGRFPAPGGPQIPVSPGQGIACVTGPGSGTLTIVQNNNGRFSHQIVEIGDTPHDAIGSDDGRHLFVACSGSGDIAKIRIETGIVERRISAGAGAGHIARHPDGKRFYCANSLDGTVSAFSVDGEGLGSSDSGGWAHHPEVSVDGRHVFVANFLDDTVSVFDADSLDRICDLETEPYAHEIAISPDGGTLILPGFSSDHIRIYDAISLKQTHRLAVGAGSPHSAFSKSGRWAYVTCSIDNHIARIDMIRREVVDQITLP